MKTENLRRPYTAPAAELVCLAPTAPIANWTWKDSGNHSWTTNHWGLKNAEELFKNASVTGIMEWADGDEFKTED